MPIIIGPVEVVNVTGGNLQFGDTLVITPKSSAKTSTGAGAVNEGIGIVTANGFSVNNVLNPNIVDQPITGNI